MKNLSHVFNVCALCVVVALAIGQPAAGQQLANDCAGGGTGTIFFGNADIPGTFTSTTRNPGLNGIDTSACPGPVTNNAGADGVICFTPQNACTMQFVCNGPSAATDALVGTGACGSMIGCQTNATNTISVALTAMTQYCLYCEHTGGALLGFTLTETGDCGALPVALQTFSVSSSDEDPDEESGPDS